MSWSEVAEVFQTSWGRVFRSVEMAVAWGLEHRDLEEVEAIGVDQVLWQKGCGFLTLVYQIDPNEATPLHAVQDLIDGPVRQAGRIHDLESAQNVGPTALRTSSNSPAASPSSLVTRLTPMQSRNPAAKPGTISYRS